LKVVLRRQYRGLLRKQIAKAFGMLQIKGGAQLVLTWLRESDAEGKWVWVYVKALGAMGAEEAVPALLEVARARSDFTGETAITALERIGGDEAVDALIALLDGPLAARAADALGRIGGARAVPALLAHADPAKRHPKARETQVLVDILYALGSIGDPQALPLAEKHLLEGDSPQVVAASAWALAAIGGDQVRERLLQALPKAEGMARWGTAGALAVLKCKEAFGPLVELLRSSEVGLYRRFAAFRLGLLGDPEAYPHLVAALDDRLAPVRARALTALARLKCPKALQYLLAAANAESVFVRHAAYWGLGELGDPAAMGRLVQGLGERRYLRKAAARALVKIKHERAEQVVRELRDDPDPAIRRIAGGGHR
jgi:HEAT repeat protein